MFQRTISLHLRRVDLIVVRTRSVWRRRISELNGARAALLSPLLAPRSPDDSWALSSVQAMLLRLDKSVRGERRTCVLPKFIPFSSYAEQLLIRFEPRGNVFHVYPAAFIGDSSQALIEYLSASGAHVLRDEIKQIPMRGAPLAYVVLDRGDETCIPFSQIIVPENSFKSTTSHLLYGSFCQRSDGDSKVNIEENILGVLKKIQISDWVDK
jgi:hypothetical protein